MRYNIISPKYIYYMGLMVHLIVLAFYSFILPKAIQSGEMVAFILILVTGTMWCLYFILFYLNKFIYISSDNSEKVIRYGSVLFSQVCKPDKIRLIKKVFWFRQTFRIQIGDKVYYFVSLQPRLESVERALKMTD